jgi:hypothetical protein
MSNNIQPTSNNLHAYSTEPSTSCPRTSEKTFKGRVVTSLAPPERGHNKAHARSAFSEQLNQLTNSELTKAVLSMDKQTAIETLYQRKVEVILNL